MELTPHEYYSMTRAEFILKLKGYQIKQVKEWEHTRQICYTIASNAFGRKSKLPNIKSWWPLITDKLNAVKKPVSEMRNKWQIFKSKDESEVKS
jgi:hypothetical protein